MSHFTRAMIIFGIGCFLVYVIFVLRGFSDNPLALAFAALYTLTAIYALLLVRAILGFVVDFSRPIRALQVLTSITDPFIGLFDPVTPPSAPGWMRPFVAVFYLFTLSIVLFGGPAYFPAPPLWAVLIDQQSLPQIAQTYLSLWARSVGAVDPI